MGWVLARKVARRRPRTYVARSDVSTQPTIRTGFRRESRSGWADWLCGDSARRTLLCVALVWGALLALYLARVYFELPPERVHRNHELNSYAVRLLEFRDLIGSGYFFPQWATHFRGGFGSPYFGYYQPGVFYAASLVPWGISPSRALGLTVIVFSLVGYTSMFIMVRRTFGTLAGTLAGSLLLLSVYSATEIYVRGDLAEFCSMMLVVLALAALDGWLRSGCLRHAVVLALAGAATIVTHAAVSLVSYGLIAAVLLGLSWHPPIRRRVLGAGVALVAGVGIAAFYWFPVFFEWDLVTPQAAFSDYYRYWNHFVSPGALVDVYRVDVDRRGRNIPFTLGRLSVGLMLLNSATVILSKQRAQRLFFLIGWSCLVLVVFMMTEASRWIWAAIELLQRLQFPWRLLTLTTILVAALAGAIPRWPWQPLRVGVAAAAVLVALWCSRTYTAHGVLERPRVPATADALLKSYIAPDRRNEWMPKGASLDAARLSEQLPDTEGDVTASAYRLSQGRLQVQVDSRAGGSVRLPHYFFPVGWSARLNGEPVQLEADSLGLMRVQVPGGVNGLLELQFTMTPMRRWGLITSATTLLVGASLLLFRGRLRPRERAGRVLPSSA